ncbi:MAG TPA: hypothetical protein DHW71_10040 [Gammaproteobacteria bacterium]|nr:hypothetical protein [Gammaproteobacteria bacterium]
MSLGGGVKLMLIYLSENSNVKRCSGFTLIEMMIVIALIAALAFFTVKYSSRKFGDQLVDRSAAETINIKRAALNHFTKVGNWPDGENNCANAAAELRKYIGQTNQNAWGYAFSYSCPEITSPAPVSDEGEEQDPIQSIPSFIIQQQAPSHKAALQLARHLPATEARIGEAAGGVVPYYVETYVPMVLMPPASMNRADLIQENNGVSYYPGRCRNGHAKQIMVIPKAICPISNSPVYGYQISSYAVEEAIGGNISYTRTKMHISYRIINSNNITYSAYDVCNLNVDDIISVHEYCPNEN